MKNRPLSLLFPVAFAALAVPGTTSVALAQEAPTLSRLDYARLNQAFGTDLFADESLWDDVPADVARRVAWPRESQTKNSESYRLYPAPGAMLLGAQPNSLSLQAVAGKPAAIILFFANKGDAVRAYAAQQGEVLPEDSSEREKAIGKMATKVARELKDAIKRDADVIESRLTEALGPPRRETFGQGRELRQTVSRWDWAGHAFLLSAPANEYVELKIVPETVASADGKTERTTDAELRVELKSRVVTRPNGDVILTEIPMVDQGPKGYCVPANWERVLRYVGIPADMYELAMAGGTATGGGTYVDQMAKSVDDLARRNGRRISTASGKPYVRTVKKYIDDGVPLMWGIGVIESLDVQLSERARQRTTVEDPKVWKDFIKPLRKDARKLNVREAPGHMCLIVGYNPDTEELAISDSWGPAFAERWITEDEALAISLGEMYYVSW